MYNCPFSGNPIIKPVRNHIDEVNDMDRRTFRNFITKRSSIWTLSLCMTGAIVLGGIAAVNGVRRSNDQETETEIGQVAYLEEEIPDENQQDLLPTIGQEDEDDLALASGTSVEENTNDTNETTDNGNSITVDTGDGTENTPDTNAEEAAASVGTASDTDDGAASDGTDTDASNGATVDNSDSTGAADETAEASSAEIISQQTLLDAGVSFTDGESILWPAAGTILIDYSMDSSVYFPTLDQYKYNPALIIGSDAGNQVLASAKGIVESISVNEETGTTLVLNIGNGFKLTYGQLKELAVSEGDVVESGELIGYVSEPTIYYSEEGSNLYFAMTQDGAAVDPVLYLE